MCWILAVLLGCFGRKIGMHWDQLPTACAPLHVKRMIVLCNTCMFPFSTSNPMLHARFFYFLYRIEFFLWWRLGLSNPFGLEPWPVSQPGGTLQEDLDIDKEMGEELINDYFSGVLWPNPMPWQCHKNKSCTSSFYDFYGRECKKGL